MSGSISVSPFGRMPSFGLACGFGAAFWAFADGDEQPTATPMAAAATTSIKGFIIFIGGLPETRRRRARGYHFQGAQRILATETPRHRAGICLCFSLRLCVSVANPLRALPSEVELDAES